MPNIDISAAEIIDSETLYNLSVKIFSDGYEKHGGSYSGIESVERHKKIR